MKKILLAPGPVPTSPEILKALSAPIAHHRTRDFESLFHSCLVSLKKLFNAEGHVFVVTATGSGAMEAGLVNVLQPKARVLAIVSGYFGERWAKMAEVYGAHVDRYQVPWGQAVDLSELEKRMQTNQFDLVLTQACETSTATLHPISAMGSLIKRHQPNCLFLVDGITAVGGTDISMSRDSIDVLTGGAQKSLMLITGLSFVGFSHQALNAMHTNTLPRFYFDLRPEFEANQKNQMRFSAPVNQIYSLRASLDQFDLDGGQRIKRDILKRSFATQKLLPKLGLSLFSQHPSPTLTAFLPPAGIDALQLKSGLEKTHGVTLMGGQGELTGKILRIGHMGEISTADMLGFFDALVSELRFLGQSIDHDLAKSLRDEFEADLA